jgi:hypothetical protein
MRYGCGWLLFRCRTGSKLNSAIRYWCVTKSKNSIPQGVRSYWELVEPLFDAVDIDSSDGFFASLRGLNPSRVNLFAAHFCLSEVHNGGFLQFFWNRTGVLAPESIEGFRSIGMPNLAAVVSVAAAHFGSPYPRDREERWDALLAATGRSEEELESIFQKESNLYLAFQKAAETLDFDTLDTRALQLASEENGDFGNAATAYAHSIGLFE